MARLIALIVMIVIANPAAAHSLRVFARAGAEGVAGYGFFVGGGRPQGIGWHAEIGGTPLAEGVTDAAGGFAFAVPQPVRAPVTVTLDTGEGHIARATLPPERFAAAPDTAPDTAPITAPDTAPPPHAPPSAPGPAAPSAPDLAAPHLATPHLATPGLSAAELSALIETAAARATAREIAREIAPLRERIEAMDSRLRLTDLIAGLCLIAGMAGLALWARGRGRG